jgi:hypothetical protein
MVLFVRDINAGRPFLQLTDEADSTQYYIGNENWVLHTLTASAIEIQLLFII